MNIWLQRILFLILGLAAGVLIHFPQTGRFVPDGVNNAILDTKSGLECAPIRVDNANLPYCGDLYKHY